MPRYLTRLFVLVCCATALPAQAPHGLSAIPLESLAAFAPPTAGWQLVGDLSGDPRHDVALTAQPGTGLLISRSTTPLVTVQEHGDIDLDLDFLVTPHSQATIRLQGRYAFRLTDGHAHLATAPRADATRAPGLWQRLHVEFRAPRFDSTGRKIASARFAKIVLNGFTIHENLELPSLSSGGPFADEKPLGPLALAATRGAIAVRAISLKTPPTSAAAPSPAPKAKGKQPVTKAPKQPPKIVSIPVEVTDTIILQRGFIPFEPKKRLYATSVGTPAGVHYSYDFETGALLRAWRGRFIDAGEMWEGRSANQWAKPSGPALTLNALPSVAVLALPATPWPAQPDPQFASQGYLVEPDGQPVFLSTLGPLSIRDRIAPATKDRALTRTLTLRGTLPAAQPVFILLAAARAIAPQPGGTGFVIGDREYYLDLPANAAASPILRTLGDRQFLLVPVTADTLTRPVVYTLVW